MERFTGRRWNGAEWNRLELAKSGPSASRCVGGSGFRRLIGGRGFGGLYRANPATGSRLCEALGAGIVREEICLSRFFLREKQERPGDYYFLLPACLADTASFFFWAALSALDFCCVDFFWLDFGDLSPIILLLFFALIGLRHN